MINGVLVMGALLGEMLTGPVDYATCYGVYIYTRAGA